MALRYGAKLTSIFISFVLAFSFLGVTGIAYAAEETVSNVIHENVPSCESSTETKYIEDFELDKPQNVTQNAQTNSLSISDDTADDAKDNITVEMASTNTSNECANNSIFPINLAPQAETNGDVIKKIEALWWDGSGHATSVGWYDTFRINVEFALPNGQVHRGDTTTINLPPELVFYQDYNFAIFDDQHNVIATAVIDASAKVIRLTYTSYPETNSDVSGSFYFYVKINHEIVPTAQDIELKFNVDGRIIYGGVIHSGDKPTPNVPKSSTLRKNGWQSSENNRILNHVIAINRGEILANPQNAGPVIMNAELTDSIQTSDTYIQSSLCIVKGKWKIINNAWVLTNPVNVTPDYPIIWNSDNKSFSVKLGDLHEYEGFNITYSTKTNYDPVDGEIFNNHAQLKSQGVEIKHTDSSTLYFSGGGYAQGYTYTIAVHKQNKDGKPLEGAKFDVIRVNTRVSVGTIITNADGLGMLSGLLHDTYQLHEIQAPLGYLLLVNPVDVSVNAFNEDKIAHIIVTNNLKTPDKDPRENPEPQPSIPDKVLEDEPPIPNNLDQELPIYSQDENKTVSPIPKTGDNFNSAVVAIVVLLLLFDVIVVGIMLYRRNK